EWQDVDICLYQIDSVVVGRLEVLVDIVTIRYIFRHIDIQIVDAIGYVCRFYKPDVGPNSLTQTKLSINKTLEIYTIRWSFFFHLWYIYFLYKIFFHLKITTIEKDATYE